MWMWSLEERQWEHSVPFEGIRPAFAFENTSWNRPVPSPSGRATLEYKTGVSDKHVRWRMVSVCVSHALLTYPTPYFSFSFARNNGGHGKWTRKSMQDHGH
jgi:hypothetical protein